MIDVIIGLVLVIALASLMVSILAELHATLLGSRGTMLKRQLSSIGGDKDAFAAALLESPLIKSISKYKNDKEQRPPSYISGDMFVAALLDRLDQYTGGQRASDPASLMSQLSSSAPPEFVGAIPNLKSLTKGAERDWGTFEGRLLAWYEEVGQRTTGWFVRQNQVRLIAYGFLLAATLNINPVVIGDTLWHDAGMRKTMVAQGELVISAFNADRNPARSGAASKQRDPAEKQVLATNAVLAELRAQLDAWYRQKEKASVAADHPDVKLLLAAQKNVTEARTYLDRDRKAAASAPNPQTSAELDVLVLNLPDFANSGFQPEKARGPLAALVNNFRTAWYAERDIRLGASTADNEQIALPDNFCDKQDQSERGLCTRLLKAGVFEKIAMPIGWSFANWPKTFKFDCQLATNSKTKDKDTNALDTCPKDLGGMLTDNGTLKNLPLAVTGWLITALAISLGAPFWFDLLGKLIKIRGSGAKPELPGDAANAGDAPNTTPSVLARPATVPPLASASALALLPASEPKLIPFSDAVNDTEHRLNSEEITRLQRALGMPTGEQSGCLDGVTRTYLQKWQTSQGADASGELTETQALALLHPREEDDYVG